MSSNELLKFRNKVFNCIKSLIKYNDIGFIFDNIDSIVYLHIPFKNKHVSEEQFQKNREIAFKTLETAKVSYEDFMKELELRERVFKKVREINPEFCMNMKAKISNEEYDTYKRLLEKSIKSITRLFNSIYSENSIDYEELILKKQDKISDIIDSADSSQLSQIEDTFVLNELNSIDYSQIDE